MFEGRRLILPQGENEPHGEFTNILEHNLKLPAAPRAA